MRGGGILKTVVIKVMIRVQFIVSSCDNFSFFPFIKKSWYSGKYSPLKPGVKHGIDKVDNNILNFTIECFVIFKFLPAAL